MVSPGVLLVLLWGGLGSTSGLKVSTSRRTTHASSSSGPQTGCSQTRQQQPQQCRLRNRRPTRRRPLSLRPSNTLSRLTLAYSVEELLAHDAAAATAAAAAEAESGFEVGEDGEGFDAEEAFMGKASEGSAGREGLSLQTVGRYKDQSVLRQLLVLATVVGLGLVVFDYQHGMARFHWMQNWAGGAAPHLPPRATTNSNIGVHLTPLRSMMTGLGAGFTRAVSRTLTFPLDTLKTRSQVSKLGLEDRAALPEEMRRMIEQPASFKGVFKGFSAFLAQAGPSNAIFFLVYDALNALGAAALVTAGGGAAGGFLPTALHLGASSLATVPSNIVKTPAEVVKQRLQVGQETGNALEALLSIVETDGVGGLFVGGKEQLIREIPFNAIQFTVYEGLKANTGSLDLWVDAALGAISSAVGAVATQPVDTVKTRVMTKSVPGMSNGEGSGGFLRSAALVAEAEGVSSLFLGLWPRLVLVSTGGAFYFWGQEFASVLLSRAGF